MTLDATKGTFLRLKIFEPSNLEEDRFDRPNVKISDHYHPDRWRLTTAQVDEVSGSLIVCREVGRTVDSVFVDGYCPDFNGQYKAWIVKVLSQAEAHGEHRKDEYLAAEADSEKETQ